MEENNVCMNNKPLFNLEFNITDFCNMSCEYCFESDSKCRDINLDADLSIKRTNELLENKWFNDNFIGIKIDFWGGEPTVNMPIMRKIIEKYIDNPKVIEFHIYSNGYRVKRLYNLLKSYSYEKRQKFDIQFSYDGNPVHDMRRKDKKNKPTGKKVLENTEMFYEIGVPILFKSTIQPSDFKYMSQVWDDFKILYDKYNDKIIYKSFGYHPTIDYYSKFEKDYMEDFKNSITEIARKEVTFNKQNGDFLFKWFKGGKKQCGAGKYMVVIDLDGDVCFCHGCLYNELKDDLKITNIKRDNFVEDVRNNYERMERWIEKEPEECITCSATQCLRCNAKKYEISKKNTPSKKWNDYTNQPEICKYFKVFGNIDRALKQIILEERINGRS